MTKVYILHTKQWGIEGAYSSKDRAIEEKIRLVGYAAYRVAEEALDDDGRLHITCVTIDENDSVIDTGC